MGLGEASANQRDDYVDCTYLMPAKENESATLVGSTVNNWVLMNQTLL